MKTVEISGVDGAIHTADCAGEIGDMIITRLSGRDWRITHEPTGFALPYEFEDAGVAGYVLGKLDEFVEWDWLVEELAKGHKPAVIDRIKDVCREFGTVSNCTKAAPKQRGILAERLGISTNS